MADSTVIPYKDAFYYDGSLRDIYVLGTTEQDWQMLLDFLRMSAYSLDFIVAGKYQPIPEHVGDIFVLELEIGVNLCIDKKHLALNCHFFTSEEIEFDLDPRDMNSQQQVSRLLDFIRQVGRLLNKAVILTPENSPHVPCPWFRFDPKTGTEEWSDNENNIITEHDPQGEGSISAT